MGLPRGLRYAVCDFYKLEGYRTDPPKKRVWDAEDYSVQTIETHKDFQPAWI